VVKGIHAKNLVCGHFWSTEKHILHEIASVVINCRQEIKVLTIGLSTPAPECIFIVEIQKSDEVETRISELVTNLADLSGCVKEFTKDGSISI
jgi:hypothetical protein